MSLSIIEKQKIYYDIKRAIEMVIIILKWHEIEENSKIRLNGLFFFFYVISNFSKRFAPY